MDILRDSLWQFIGALFAFVTITVSLIIYFLQRKKKRLNYEVVSRLPLLSFREELEGKFKIFYEDNQVKNVYSTIIRFYNTGNQPISSNDFERSLSLIFEDKSKILSYSVSKSEPENLDVNIELDNDKLIISPLLLNPKDNYTIRVITESEGKFTLDYRIIGVNKIVEGSPTQTSSFIYSLTGFLLTVGGIVFLVTGSTDIEKSPFETTTGSIGFILFIIGYFLVFRGIIINKKFIRKLSLATRKFLSLSKL